MHRRVCTFVTGLALLAAAGAHAQAPRGAVGIGIGLQQVVGGDEGLAIGIPQFYVPIMLADRIMVEPSFGVVRVNFEDDDSDSEVTNSLLRLGVGVLFSLWPGGPDGHAYVGPRIGIVRSSTEIETPTVDIDESDTNLFLAGVLGGEFFLRPRFSLGGEAGLEWLKFDDDDGDDASLLRTIAEFRVRWYFP